MRPLLCCILGQAKKGMNTAFATHNLSLVRWRAEREGWSHKENSGEAQENGRVDWVLDLETEDLVDNSGSPPK